MTKTLPSWPPQTTDEQRAALLREASAWALAHGFTLLPPTADGQPLPPAPTHAIAAPLSLFPTPFPRSEYLKAKSIHRAYNALYARITLDWEFLDRVLGAVAEVDEFQAELWSRWKAIRGDLEKLQPVQLSINRSDYLLHTAPEGLAIQQVEFNTIAASFGALSQKAGELHRYLAATTGYYGADGLLVENDAYPDNKSLEGIAGGLGEGWRAYGVKDAVVLEVVQDGERNVFDQRGLEYELQAKHNIKTLRHTFGELATIAKVNESGKLFIPNSLNPSSAPSEVAVIYYRAAYTPRDYPTGKEWDTRVFLERTTAIKCPTMALQLAGAKKVQQELAREGLLEDFLLGATRPDVGFGAGAGSLTQADVDALRNTFTGLWPLDNSPLGQEAQKLARTQPERFVLKPQREGGGNNIYRNDIPAYLDKLDAEPLAPGAAPKREGYILMELIEPPQNLHNYLVRGGEGKARLADVVSELGVYGVVLFGDDKTPAVNREVGTLLRTKGRESDEGGVAIGISSIDSPILV